MLSLSLTLVQVSTVVWCGCVSGVYLTARLTHVHHLLQTLGTNPVQTA